jgi:23S rRNA G2069 N7-methylase RlmK/C1962 C5-methylase RlmI
MTEEEKTAYQAEMLLNRIKKRDKHLSKWAKRFETDAFRLYDRDIPEIPLVIDRYKDAVSGALFERPYEKDETEEERWLKAMADAISVALAIPEDRIFLKIRKRMYHAPRMNPAENSAHTGQYAGRGQWGQQDAGLAREHLHGKAGNGFSRNQYERESHRNFYVDVREGDMVFRVNLSDYLDTGLFLDRRKLRGRIRAEATDKKLLNLFCYTAGFSLAAAKGGASKVDSVDMSNTYLDWAKVNFAINGLRAEIVGTEAGTAEAAASDFRLIRADALRFLDDAARARRRWDIIVLDPPTFSNSKKMVSTLDVSRDYQNLIGKCLKLVDKGGKLYFSTNARHFRLEADGFPAAHAQDISEQLRDEDFRGKISACWEIGV